jgi:ABC-type glycerol-3-phosphate transport system substrate-binding protein
MKKKVVKFLPILLVVVLLVVLLTGKNSRLEEFENEVSASSYHNAYEYLSESLQSNSYINVINDVAVDYSLEDSSAVYDTGVQNSSITYEGDNVVEISRNNPSTFKVDVLSEGYYYLNIDYYLNGDTLNDYLISVKINDDIPFAEAELINVPIIWEDETKEYDTDRYGDEFNPKQLVINGWHNTNLYDNRYYTEEGLLFHLVEGENIIEFENDSTEVLYIGNVTVVAPRALVSYDEYFNSNSGSTKNTIGEIFATSYAYKNSSFVRVNNTQTPDVEPFDTEYKKINIVESWDEAGQMLHYVIDVETAGFYELSMYYKTESADYDVFRTVRINGEIPFEEVKSYQVKATDNDWEILTFGGDTPYQFYFEAGENVLTLSAEVAPLAQSINDLQLVVNHINSFALDIKKIAGDSADKDRTWELTKILPETEENLKAYETILKYNMLILSQYSTERDLSSELSYLNMAINIIEDVSENPDELPLYIDDLYSGSSSVNQYLGDSISFYETQEITLNRLILGNQEVKNLDANFFQKLVHLVKDFYFALTSDKYYTYDENGESIQIWVGRSTTYVDAMQKMADSSTYLKDEGITVDFSVMPNVDKLVLASAGDTTPDGALGLPSYVPYKLAIRGALYDMTEFDDFWSYSSDKFVPGSMVSYTFNEGVYAVPETINFSALMYRSDIFESLDIEVPDTWDDMIGILPQLQRYDMNFYYPTAGDSSTKWFYQTVPFIYQYGGDIYASDGMSVELDDQKSVEALQFLGDLFTTYSVPTQVPSFYNEFRYASLPIGIVTFNDYVTIKTSAPEIDGKWELAPTPAYVDEETGESNRWYVGNGMGGIIFNDSEKKDEVWSFYKWWLSTDTQIEFANNLLATYGPTFLWLSSNYNAIEELPIPQDDKDVILSQIQWLRDVPRTPGEYLVERGLSDIWNKMVFENSSARVAIDDVATDMNREIERKLTEFGYLEDGVLVKEYTVADIEWIQEKMDEYSGE